MLVKNGEVKNPSSSIGANKLVSFLVPSLPNFMLNVAQHSL